MAHTQSDKRVLLTGSAASDILGSEACDGPGPQEVAEVPGAATQILTHHADSAILGGSVFVNHTQLLIAFYPDPEPFRLKCHQHPSPRR